MPLFPAAQGEGARRASSASDSLASRRGTIGFAASLADEEAAMNGTLDLEGQRVWVVGAGGGGIGTAVCGDLSGAGAHVVAIDRDEDCLLYTSPSPRDKRQSRMPSSA